VDGLNIRKIVKLNMMRRLTIMSILEDVYPWIKNHYGRSKYKKQFPSIKYETNIYARLSGNPMADGENSETIVGEYDRKMNTIYIYYPNIKDELHLIRTLLHEFKHYLQSDVWMKRYYTMGYEYNNHPYELAALEEEKLAETVQVLTQIEY